MNRRTPHNVSAAVHQRLLNIARETARSFDEVLQYFAMERFLYRLSQTKHADSFVLKGALLFRIWDTPDSRATRDIDLLAYLDNSPDNLADIVRDICTVDSADDGLEFEPETVDARRIKRTPFTKACVSGFVVSLGMLGFTCRSMLALVILFIPLRLRPTTPPYLICQPLRSVSILPRPLLPRKLRQWCTSVVSTVV